MSNIEHIWFLWIAVVGLLGGFGWESQRLKDRVKELELRNTMRGEAAPLKDY